MNGAMLERGAARSAVVGESAAVGPWGRVGIRRSIAVGGVFSAAMLLGGCLPEPPAPPERLSPPEVEPAGPVPPDAWVALRWADGLLAWEAPPIVRHEAAVLRVEAELHETGARLRGLPRWPPGATVTVDLTGCLSGVEPESPVQFAVAPEVVVPPSPVVRRPVPGELAPSNLAWVAVAGVGGDEVRFRSEDHAWMASRAALSVFEVARVGPCAGPCAGRAYVLIEPPGGSGARARVQTATVSDHRAPELLSVGPPVAEPGRLVVDLEANETVRGGGVWTSAGADGRMIATGLPGRQARLTAEPAPPAGRQVRLELWVEDLAGNRATVGLDAESAPEVFVHVSELVPAPRRDWGDSEPEGEPFDRFPGRGTVSSADEWVELVHTGEEAVRLDDLGLELRTLDGSPAVTVVADAPALRFGDGGDPTAWRPGEALVVRTRGDMAQRDLVVELWAGAHLVDRVELSDQPGADHPGGAPPDLEHDALARGWDGRFRWCRPSPGSPIPADDCR